MKNHRRTHEPKSFPCRHCDKSFAVSGNRDTHERVIHEKERRFACAYEDCNFAAGYKKVLDAHVLTHTGERPFACTHDECDARFTTRGNLHDHVRAVHEKQTPYVCTYEGCEYVAGYKQALNQHVRSVHLKERRFTCTYEGCTYAASQAIHLAIHVRAVHEKQTPYACTHDGCGQLFTQSGARAIHVRAVHEKQRPFECTYQGCNYAASQATHLAIHVRTHTGEKPYKCHHCNDRFSNSGNRDAHEKRRHELKNNEVLIKKKEERMNRLLASNGIGFDRELFVSYKNCGENDTFARLDFVVNSSLDVVTIVSCDEMQHKDREVLCEVARMTKVVAAVRASGDMRKILWVRFNPDTVALNSENVRRPIKDREAVLLDTIRGAPDFFNDREQEVAIVYMYYDAYETRDGTLRADVTNHPDYADVWKPLIARVIV
jgi:hypothetical protein